MNGPLFDVQRLFGLMEKHGTGLLLVSSRHNVRYLTGGYYYPLYMWDNSTRRTQYLSFIAIPLNRVDESFFIGRPGENAFVEEAEVWPGACLESAEIGSRAPIGTTVSELKRRDLDRGTIAVELSSLPADAFQLLTQGLPGASFVDASMVLDPLRARKRPDELCKIREGLRRNLLAVEYVLRSGRSGESTLEIAERMQQEFHRAGLSFLYSLICAGPGLFRAPSKKRFWRTGQPLHIDAGGLIEGYNVEVCRSGFLGKPSVLADELLHGCQELSTVVLKLMRPGAVASDIQRGAAEFLRGHRHGRYGNFVAHGIGLVHHEDPVINARSQDVLSEGMVISVETEFLVPETGHIKVEDTVVITEGGNECMTPGGFEWCVAGS